LRREHVSACVPATQSAFSFQLSIQLGLLKALTAPDSRQSILWEHGRTLGTLGGAPAGEPLDKLRYSVFTCSNWGWGYFNAYDYAATLKLDFWMHVVCDAHLLASVLGMRVWSSQRSL
jgi:hypothetical protein